MKLLLSLSAAAWCSAAPVHAEAPARVAATQAAVKEKPKFVFNLMPKSLRWRPDLDIWVVTERTERGATIPEPTPAEPQHYQLVAAGYHSRGQDFAAERAAKAEALGLVLDKTLREQSLLPASAEAPATLVLTYTWGTHFRARPHYERTEHSTMTAGSSGVNWGRSGGNRWESYSAFDGPRTASSGGSWGFGTGDNGGWTYGPTGTGGASGGSFGSMSGSSSMGSSFSSGSEIEVSAPMSHADMCERAALLVGENFAREMRGKLEQYNEDVDKPGESWGVFTRAARLQPRGYFLLSTMDNSLYYLVVSAFDAKAIAAGRKELLWRTKIAVTDEGISQVEAFPAVINAAARYFGRDTGDGQLLQRKLDRKGRVILGEPEVIDWKSEQGTPAKDLRTDRR